MLWVMDMWSENDLKCVCVCEIYNSIQNVASFPCPHPAFIACIRKSREDISSHEQSTNGKLSERRRYVLRVVQPSTHPQRSVSMTVVPR